MSNVMKTLGQLYDANNQSVAPIKIKRPNPVVDYGAQIEADFVNARTSLANSMTQYTKSKTNKLNSLAGNVVNDGVNGGRDVVLPSTGNLDKATDSYTKLGLSYSQPKRDTAGCSDCSRAVNRVMKSATGKSVGDTTLAQRSRGTQVDAPSDGTLIHFNNKKGGRHVGIYRGDGKMWHFGVNGAQARDVNQYLKSNPSLSIHSYRNY